MIILDTSSLGTQNWFGTTVSISALLWWQRIGLQRPELQNKCKPCLRFVRGTNEANHIV